jgi:nitrite reductase (NADH) small subunit/3-phenylpropionate/trans-cinnamate dioxygenase ferredoxin subunit
MEGELKDGESRVVDMSGKDVAVFFTGGSYFAIDDRCPHAGASLSAGCVEDGVVTCPWHYWRFRLSDGTWADNPRIKTGSYPLAVEAGVVYIEAPE